MSLRLVPPLTAAIFAFAPALAAGDDGTSGGTGADGLWVQSIEHGSGSNEPRQPNDPAPQANTGPVLQIGSAGCAGANLAAGHILDLTFCDEQPEAISEVLTISLIRRAFAELELPASTLVIQPPDGLTLVNFDTNFYTTDTRPISRTVMLLGRRVTLEATPSTFHWRFGDGERLSTSEPGAPYPDLTVTHNYLRKGTYRPSLATTYTGRYRVGGGPWRTIPGTVTIDGTGQPLRAIEAQPKLVSY